MNKRKDESPLNIRVVTSPSALAHEAGNIDMFVNECGGVSGAIMPTDKMQTRDSSAESISVCICKSIERCRVYSPGLHCLLFQ